MKIATYANISDTCLPPCKFNIDHEDFVSHAVRTSASKSSGTNEKFWEEPQLEYAAQSTSWSSTVLHQETRRLEWHAKHPSLRVTGYLMSRRPNQLPCGLCTVRHLLIRVTLTGALRTRHSLLLVVSCSYLLAY